MSAQPSPPPCRRLEWDSQFFGKTIAQVESARLTPGLVTEILHWCRENSVDCLYFLADDQDYETARLAAEQGFVNVDTRVTLERELAGPAIPSKAAHIRPFSPLDLEPLKSMAADLYRDTRFFFDAHFPPARAGALYATWTEKCTSAPDSHVLVAEQDSQPVGYVTCRILSKRRGQIELIGVSGSARGKGLGSALLAHSLSWFSTKGAKRVSVVTQLRNRASLRAYERTGFIVSSVQHWYHKWFNRS